MCAASTDESKVEETKGVLLPAVVDDEFSQLDFSRGDISVNIERRKLTVVESCSDSIIIFSSSTKMKH